jgi:protease IV
VEGQKNRSIFSILILVVVFFVVLMVFASYTINMFKSSDVVTNLNSEEAALAVIEVKGVIKSAKVIVEKLHIAEKDDSVKAIILRVISPGGAVAPTQEIYNEIIRIDKKKPIYASFGTVAASGGYYLGAATRRIYANAGTLTGSIGVIMQFMDMSKLFEFAKVSPKNIKAGQFKDIGSPNRAMTRSEEGLLNTMLADVHKQFVTDILARRKKLIKGDIWDHAQGQIFSGDQAKKLGLVDEIESLWSAGRKIHEELKLSGEFKLRYIEKKKNRSFWELFDKLDTVSSFITEKTVGNISPMYLFGK